MYYLPKDQFYGLQYIPQVSNETNDEVYYELGRFVELLLKNNPIIFRDFGFARRLYFVQTPSDGAIEIVGYSIDAE